MDKQVQEWGTGSGGDTAAWYRRFAEAARGHSEPYARLAAGIADDAALLERLESLPQRQRQPNLLLGAVRFHGGPVQDYAEFRPWVLDHWPQLAQTMARRRTQTNEAARCAVLLPLLAQLPQPLALIEVGASAGLCLYPDRYRCDYGGRSTMGPADSGVTLTCDVEGPAPLPAPAPRVAWRAGVDLNPLDAADDDDLRWLESLIWPGHLEEARLQRLRAAARIARADPPHLVRGDLNTDLASLVAQAPSGATPVVFHSAVLAYLDPAQRQAFAQAVRGLGVHWISNEGPPVGESLGWKLPGGRAPAPTELVLALDERPVAYTGQHGQHLAWFAPPL